ncbi:MAG: hypothetical protein H8D34_18780 [Chloroflexi bacterium]|nr:hypothetical protein [Chloroflexota bacterium]MBL7162896.1 hypothetical protein [Anaerolineales bacterium]
MNKNLSPSQLAWEILREAEEAFDAISMAEEAAIQNGHPQPQSIQEYLGWIEREAVLQQDLLHSDPQESDRVYAQALRELAEELRPLGFRSARSGMELNYDLRQ